MGRESEQIRPETHALDAYIQATVQRLLAGDPRSPAVNDGLLFLGNWHDAMPRLIFQDPVLQPVDSRIWGVLKIAAAGTGPTEFPTYKQIARTANVGSEATVARSMAILRAARWLSLCRRVRDAQGRFRGNVYALHDEPLPLADALYLDRDYVTFLEQAQSHAHPQVRKVAAAALGAIEEDIQAGDGRLENINPMHRRQQALRTLQGEATRFFGFSSRQLQNLKSVPTAASAQKMKCGSPQNLKSASCSSSCINIKTTTTTTELPDSRAQAHDAPTESAPALPAALTRNEQRLATICLRGAPEAMHQDILDELAGRLLVAKRRGDPIDNPIGYLTRLCKAARDGTFTLTSLGLQAREARQQEARLKRIDEVSRDRALTDMQALLAKREQAGTGSGSRTADGSAIASLKDSVDGSAIDTPTGPSNGSGKPSRSPR